MPRTHFWIYIYSYRMVLLRLKFLKNFNFNIVNFLFLDGDVPRSTSYGVYISPLIRFARVSSHVDDFNIHKKFWQQNFSHKDIDITNFLRRFQNFDLVFKYNDGLNA